MTSYLDIWQKHGKINPELVKRLQRYINEHRSRKRRDRQCNLSVMVVKLMLLCHGPTLKTDKCKLLASIPPTMIEYGDMKWRQGLYGFFRSPSLLCVVWFLYGSERILCDSNIAKQTTRTEWLSSGVSALCAVDLVFDTVYRPTHHLGHLNGWKKPGIPREIYRISLFLCNFKTLINTLKVYLFSEISSWDIAYVWSTANYSEHGTLLALCRIDYVLVNSKNL